MANKKVTVVFKDGEFFVDPPVVTLKFRSRGDADTLKLSNRTDESLVWNVEDAAPFGAPVLELIKKGKVSHVKSAKKAPGTYAYQVLLVKSGEKARGNSDPVIIIEI
jgi:hypothetical protein